MRTLHTSSIALCALSVAACSAGAGQLGSTRDADETASSRAAAIEPFEQARACQRFGSRTAYTGVGEIPRQVIAAPLWAGATPAVVERSGHDPTLALLLGNGDGTFGGPTILTIGTDRLSSFAEGDFDGDGLVDLAVASTPSTGYKGAVNVLLGTGAGAFAPPVVYKTDWPSTVLAADFDGDRVLDLVVVGSPGVGSGGLATYAVDFLRGHGDGTFAKATSVAAPELQGAQGVVTADFNGDGFADLAVGGGVGFQDVEILLGEGDGTFPTAIRTSSGVYVEDLAAGDFNGDGIPDLAFAHVTQTVGLMLGKGDGTFDKTKFTSSGSQDSGFYYVLAADIDGDGHLDVVATGSGGRTVPSGYTFMGNGQGDLKRPEEINLGHGRLDSYGSAVADFNGDGKLDLAVTTTVELRGVNEVNVMLGCASTPQDAR